MASNRGPNAVGNSANAVVPTPAPAENSEYYKARNAQGGQAFSWAATGGGGGGGGSGAPPVAAPSPAVPTGVGGSWANAPVAPQQQPQPAAAAGRTPQMSVAARSRAEAHGVSSAVPVTGGSGGFGGNNGSLAARGGDYEKNLIAELCPPGGMKAEPPDDKLEEFARAVPSLNPDLVCPALLDALEDGNPWIMRAKALCVIETVLRVEAENGSDSQSYTDFFHACSGEIEPLANHARSSVKGPAKRVLTALGVVNGSSAMLNGAAAPPPATAAAPPTNLLDFDDEKEKTPAAGGDSLFSGLSTKAATAPTPQPPAPPVAVQQQHQDDDLLGGPPEISAVAAPEATAPATVSPSNNDLFGNMNVKSSTTETKGEPASEVSV